MPPRKKRASRQNKILRPTDAGEFWCTWRYTLHRPEKWGPFYAQVCERLGTLPYVRRAWIPAPTEMRITIKHHKNLDQLHSFVQEQVISFTKRPSTLVEPRSRIWSESKLSLAHSRNEKRERHRKFKQVAVAFEEKRKRNAKWQFSFERRLQRYRSIVKYIRQEIKYRQRRHPILIRERYKCSMFEYRRTKRFQEERDRQRERYVQKTKEKIKPHRDVRKEPGPYKRTTTFGWHKKLTEIPRIKTSSTLNSLPKSFLLPYIRIPLASIVAVSSSAMRDSMRRVVRYYDQQIFIYALPRHVHRPSTKYLVETCSASGYSQHSFPPLDTPELKSIRQTDTGLTHPIQPTKRARKRPIKKTKRTSKNQKLTD